MDRLEVLAELRYIRIKLKYLHPFFCEVDDNDILAEAGLTLPHETYNTYAGVQNELLRLMDLVETMGGKYEKEKQDS